MNRLMLFKEMIGVCYEKHKQCGWGYRFPYCCSRNYIANTEELWLIYLFFNFYVNSPEMIWGRSKHVDVLVDYVFFFLSFSLWLVGSFPSGVVANYSFHCCVRWTIYENVYSYNKNQRDALLLKFILVKNSTCSGQIYCPSSGVSQR